MSKTKEYSNGEVTIVWKPNLCIHSTNCIKGLPEVFDMNKRPWINADGSTSDKIINQVRKCPSGALSFYMNTKKQKGEQNMSNVKVDLMENGPILVNGKIELKNSKGEAIPCENTVALCRCGGSKNKPFCDGTHNTNGFKE
ncbi:MAG: (4Fe-4S)-binding protein [Bacteroidales bacterium]|nr:(4Fe-4S)-binding protein [Bacteroidales bacterium]